MTADALATVQEWHADEGWGRVVVAGSGDDVWVHFSAIEGRTLGALHVGETVRVTYGRESQPGEVQAERVVPTTGRDRGPATPQPPGAAYRSSLTTSSDSD